MKSREKIFEYLKERATILGQQIGYYETLERDRGWMKSDDMLAYSIAQAQLNEIERFIQFMEISAK